MKILVVGGAGYIGSHVVYELLRAHYEVVVFDNLSTGNRAAVPKGVRFVQGDLLSKQDVNKVMSEHVFDAVMHFAAKLIVPESIEQPIMYYENNVYGLCVLLEAMKNRGVKNFVFSSTAAVYGQPEFQDTDQIVHEQTMMEPINPYGKSKKAAEDLVIAACVAHGMNYMIFRYFNVAGADESQEIGLSSKCQLTHLIPVVMETLLGQRSHCLVYGTDYATPDGTCIRDYIHVTDLARAHVLGVRYLAEQQNSDIINLGTGSGFSVLEIIAAAEQAVGSKVNYLLEKRRAGDPAVLVASNDKAKQLLGWVPQLTLEDILMSDHTWRKNRKY